MKFCSECGASVEKKIPVGDNRPRFICNECGMIHYENPKIVAGCIPEYGDQILLCKRAIEPRLGHWTLPAGFMELSETSLEAAVRETQEEANARVKVLGLFVVFNVRHANQVYMMFRAQMEDKNFFPGAESLDVALFSEAEICWEDLAFSTIRYTLRLFFEDSQKNKFRLHTGDIIKQASGDSYIAHPVI